MGQLFPVLISIFLYSDPFFSHFFLLFIQSCHSYPFIALCTCFHTRMFCFSISLFILNVLTVYIVADLKLCLHSFIFVIPTMFFDLKMLFCSFFKFFFSNLILIFNLNSHVMYQGIG